MSDPMLPFGTNFCKCATCGHYFGGVGAFDIHLPACREDSRNSPSVVRDKEGRQVLTLNAKGYWIRDFRWRAAA